MTKSRMIRGELPTPADVIERQREAIKERLLKTLNNNTYADYHLIISDIANEGFDYVDIAAAALQLSIEGVKEKDDILLVQ